MAYDKWNLLAGEGCLGAALVGLLGGDMDFKIMDGFVMVLDTGFTVVLGKVNGLGGAEREPMISSLREPMDSSSSFLVMSTVRDCSLFIGSTGPVFCGKDPRKMFLSRQQKFPKKLVSRQWKEGKKSMYHIITLYSQYAGGTICNAVIATYSWGLGVL